MICAIPWQCRLPVASTLHSLAAPIHLLQAPPGLPNGPILVTIKSSSGCKIDQADISELTRRRVVISAIPNQRPCCASVLRVLMWRCFPLAPALGRLATPTHLLQAPLGLPDGPILIAVEGGDRRQANQISISRLLAVNDIGLLLPSERWSGGWGVL